MESGMALAAFMIIGAVVVLGLFMSGYSGDPSNPSSLASIPSAPAGSNASHPQEMTDNAITASTSSLASDSDLTLDIRIPKAVYSVGENFIGEYYVRYNGTPFYGIVLYCMSYPPSLGLDDTCRMARGIMGDVDFDNPKKRNNLAVLMQAEYYRNGNYFLDNGTYTYSISIYDCGSVDMQLNTSGCAGYLEDESSNKLLSLQRFGPMLSKSVTVIGNRKHECSTNLECAACSGCVTGMQACLSNELGYRCIDCYMDSMCNNGYKCQKNKCVFQN